MGAFGELLIHHWGGDLDKYRGNHHDNKPSKQREATDEEMKIIKQERHDNQMKRELFSLFDKIIYGVIDMEKVKLKDFKQDDHRAYFKKWRLQKRKEKCQTQK